MNIGIQNFYPAWLQTKTIREIIEHQAFNHGDKFYLLSDCGEKRINFEDLKNHVQRIAIAIYEKGIRPGESVAYAMSNSPETILFCLGCLYGGYRLTAINLVAGDKAIGYVLRHSDSRLIVYNGNNAESIQRLTTKNNLSALVVGLEEIMLGEETFRSADVLTPPDETDDGLLIYTSGTTGTPKGVLLSQKNLIAGALNTIQAHELSSSDRALCTLPLYHINAFCVTMLAPLISTGSVVVPLKFSTSSFWKTLAKTQCTWFSLVPTQISYLLHHEAEKEFDQSLVKNIRFGRSASAPLAIQTKQLFEERFGVPVIETMGLTETAAQILSNPLPPKIRKNGSPGICYGNQVYIANESFQPLPPEQKGELIVAGDNVMKGYYKNPAATEEVLEQDGRLRTGDLGYVDCDGYFFITGRLKELIIKGGENVAPREIDEVLYAHASVIEAAAFACPCVHYGQSIEACVVVNSRNVTEETLLELCQKNLGKFKTPDKIHFLESLPKGPSGKVQRLKLHEILYS